MTDRLKEAPVVGECMRSVQMCVERTGKLLLKEVP